MSMSSRDRAEMAVAYGILHGKTHDQIVDMLDADGLLATAPQIIRTVEELEAIDSDTMLISEDWDGLLSAGFCQREGRQAISHEHCFPVAVAAPAEQVRAARKALGEA